MIKTLNIPFPFCKRGIKLQFRTKLNVPWKVRRKTKNGWRFVFLWFVAEYFCDRHIKYKPEIPKLDIALASKKANIRSAKRRGLGRNDPCPCGKKTSDGKPVKFKHCCWDEEL